MSDLFSGDNVLNCEQIWIKVNVMLNYVYSVKDLNCYNMQYLVWKFCEEIV